MSQRPPAPPPTDGNAAPHPVRWPRSTHALAAVTVAATLIHFAVAPRLHGASSWAFQTGSLSVSFVCLAFLSSQLARLRREHPGAVAEAVGGPCDGQRISLPPGDPPAQVWPAQPAAGDSHYLYLRETKASRREPRYAYEQPPPQPREEASSPWQ